MKLANVMSCEPKSGKPREKKNKMIKKKNPKTMRTPSSTQKSLKKKADRWKNFVVWSSRICWEVRVKKLMKFRSKSKNGS